MGKPLGSHLFKIRWQIKCKGKGKSGGIRVITYFKLHNDKLRLVTIYDKSEKETILIKELRALVKSIE
ncbi:type II toxin-antitoxin system RelE/ParE family toxin [Dyadobacter psychrophilus]|uniref:type II toxin-antitoxin system RelE/ParE family toxin n=1 Tax=Dyadobacter psychrophilus TaxID=651661 RepID=UPI001BB00B69